MSSPTLVARGFLERRYIETPAGRIETYRPQLRLGIVSRNHPIAEPINFILDTGSDASLVPIRFARQHRLLGFDEAARWVSTRTSFQGELHGRWGTLHPRLDANTRPIPCFYYDPNASAPSGSGLGRWFDRWVRRTERPVEEPRILGCSGVLGGDLRVNVDGNREVGLYMRG